MRKIKKTSSFKKCAAAMLAGICVLSGAACGKSGDTPAGFSRVTFAYGVDGDELKNEMKKLVQAFNDSATAQENKIFVKTNAKSADGFDGFLSTELVSKRGADVVTMEDEYFRPLTNHLEPLGETASANVSKLYAGIESRLVYNVETGLSDANAKRYALPLYNNTVVTYVNVSKLKAAGVKCISVEDSDEAIAAFNAGGKDANGNTKADLGITATVLRKGFQRDNPYYGSAWSAPSSGETLIFNDKIAMNWDETEDLGRIMTKERNSSSPTDYGFYTEWWFSYAWSVGGDCIADITGNLDYKFTLPDDTANYIVTAESGFTGAFTGKKYEKGETLEFLDKIEIGAGESVQAESDGRFTVGGKTAAVASGVKAGVESGALAELPSTKKSFERFAKMAAKEYGGERISPYPTEVSANTNTSTYFISGKLAMMIERVSNLDTVKNLMSQSSQEWTIAPVPAYKEYKNPKDGKSDEVKTRGKQANHSHLLSAAIRKNSEMKAQAEIFLNWLVTEGQKLLAKDGYGSVNSDYESEVLAATNRAKNTAALLSSNKNSKKGDWAYLTDRIWIDVWAIPLNSNVRNGSMTLKDWFSGYVTETNNALAGYKK